MLRFYLDTSLVSRYTVIPQIYTDFPRAIDLVLQDSIGELERDANVSSTPPPQLSSSEMSDAEREGSPLTPLPSPKGKGKGKAKHYSGGYGSLETGSGKGKEKAVEQSSEADSGEDRMEPENKLSSKTSSTFRRSARIASSSKFGRGQKRQRSPTPSSEGGDEGLRPKAKRVKSSSKRGKTLRLYYAVKVS